MPLAATWMQLDIIILSEIQISQDNTYMWKLKYDTNEPMYEIETESQTQRKTSGCQEGWINIVKMSILLKAIYRLSACVHAQSLSNSLWPHVAYQVPLFVGFFRREYWSGLPFHLPGDISNPGIETMSPVPPALQADSLPLSHWGSPKPL